MKIRTIKRVWWRLAVAVILFGGGATIAVIGNYSKNMLLIVAGIGLAAGGVLLFFRTQSVTSARVISRDGTEPDGPINALVVSPGWLKFQHVKEPQGHEQRCLNDGKWYHVLSQGPEDTLEEYTLPDDDVDARYYDPKEFANVVSMPANQKLFEPLPSMLKTVAMGIMGIVVLGLGIVILAMVG